MFCKIQIPVSVVLLVFSKVCFAPLNIFDIRGNIIKTPDRPILIGTYGQSIGMFEYSPSLKQMGNEVGFLDISAFDPYIFESQVGKVSSAVASAGIREDLSQNLTQEFLHLNRMSSETLLFNNRAILDVHGGDDGYLEFDYKGFLVEYLPEELGRLLGKVFLEYQIKIGQLDILTCCGDSVINGIFRGIKQSGYTDILLNGYAVDSMTPPGKTSPFDIVSSSIIDNRGTSESFEVNTADFITRGVPAVPSDEYKIQFKIGNPEPAIPPPFPEILGCVP